MELLRFRREKFVNKNNRIRENGYGYFYLQYLPSSAHLTMCSLSQRERLVVFSVVLPLGEPAVLKN